MIMRREVDCRVVLSKDRPLFWSYVCMLVAGRVLGAESRKKKC